MQMNVNNLVFSALTMAGMSRQVLFSRNLKILLENVLMTLIASAESHYPNPNVV